VIEDYQDSWILWRKHKRGAAGGTDWQGRSYERVRLIPARVEETTRLAAGPGGQEILEVNEVYVREDVQIGDLINWRDLDPNGVFDEVQGRTSRPGLFGGVDHYVVSFEPR
jgi:hypothetical protein